MIALWRLRYLHWWYTGETAFMHFNHQCWEHFWSSLACHTMSINPAQIQLLQNLTLKIQGQGHVWGQSSKLEWLPIDSHRLCSCHSINSFLGCGLSKIWPWKSKVKIITQGYIVGPTSFWLTFLLFHVNQPSHSWDAVFQNLTYKIQGQGHVCDKSSKSQSGSDSLSTHTLFVPCQSAILFLWYGFFKTRPWKSQVRTRGHMVAWHPVH